MKRLYNLDYLRGIAAFGIMIFHFLAYTFDYSSLNTFIRIIGIYAVSIFYILSGLTLYYVYHDRMKPSIADLKSFYLKRFLRIFPLLWLSVVLTVIVNWKMPDITLLLLTITGLFGFIHWWDYIGQIAWSVGNELVFYAFFPVFVFLIKKSKIAFILLSIFLFSIFLFFAFHRLNPSYSLIQQWKNYTNPLNQVFFFLGGYLIGIIFTRIKISFTNNLIILAAALTLFAIYPISGDAINFVTGYNKLIFTAICFAICISFYKLTFQLPLIIDWMLSRLGESSYSVYLLHPIVYTVVEMLAKLWSDHFFYIRYVYRVSFSILLTLVISYFVYEKFEKYFMKLGRGRRKK